MVPFDGRRVIGDTQARCGRLGGGRVASGSDASADTGVGHGQVDRCACYRHGKAVRAYGTCCGHGGGTAASADDWHCEDGAGTGGRARAVGQLVDGAGYRRGERRVQVRMASTVRRWRDGRTGTGCRYTNWRSHAACMAREAGASEGGGHCEVGARDRRTATRCWKANGWHKLQTRPEAVSSADGEHCEKVSGRADRRVLQGRHGRRDGCECGWRVQRGGRGTGGWACAAGMQWTEQAAGTAKRTGASAGGRHCKMVEGRADRHLQQAC